MGLREDQIINSVHPYLGVRLRWLSDVALAVGSRMTAFSGNRSLDKQSELYHKGSGGRPVAFPGCSQHNYGWAADVGFDLIRQITSKGRGKTFTPAETWQFFNSAARHVGLWLVSGDNGHYQIYNNLEFKNWAVIRGSCNPNPPRPAHELDRAAFDAALDEFEFARVVGGISR